MYKCVLELRLVPAAYCKAYRVFLIIFHFYMILYDICILLRYMYIKRIIQEQHEWDTFTRIIKLSRGHPSSRCRFDIKAFSLDIFTRSNTFKLFAFLLFLPGVFSSQLLNNHVIIDDQMMLVLQHLPL